MSDLPSHMDISDEQVLLVLIGEPHHGDLIYVRREDIPLLAGLRYEVRCKVPRAWVIPQPAAATATRKSTAGR